MITSAYSKSSNSSGFNPILQKIYDVICEIIVCKMVCRIFLIVRRSNFVDNFIVNSTFFGTLKSPKLKYLETHLFKKISAHRFEDHIYTSKLEKKIFRKFFVSTTWSFFCDCKTTDLGLILFHIEFILYFF